MHVRIKVISARLHVLNEKFVMNLILSIYEHNLFIHNYQKIVMCSYSRNALFLVHMNHACFFSVIADIEYFLITCCSY